MKHFNLVPMRSLIFQPFPSPSRTGNVAISELHGNEVGTTVERILTLIRPLRRVV